MVNRLETVWLSCVLVFLIGLLLLPIPPAGAQSAKFEATLSGKEQAPPIDTPAKGWTLKTPPWLTSTSATQGRKAQSPCGFIPRIRPLS